MVLDVQNFLQPGQQYTFTFNTGVYRPSQDTILSALQGIPFMSGTIVARGDLLSNQIDITFVYTGDGADAVGNVAGYINSVVANWYTTFDYVSAQTGSQGVTPAPQDTSLGGLPKSLGLSTPTLALVVVGLLAVVFLASGGPGIVRSVAGK